MSKEKLNKINSTKNKFYKTNPGGGISLIVLVITIIVVIILATAVIISLQNNNPMIEANKARINSDVANMQAIFTNTVGKIMAVNQDTIKVDPKQLNTVTSGTKKTTGEATYKIMGEDGNPVVEGIIKFESGNKTGTTYYTGKELPIYSSETIWFVDENGMITVSVGGVPYGEGEQVEEEGEEIAESDNPMLQSWTNTSTTDFHAAEYREKITKIKFATNVKVPNSKIASWDVSEAKDGSVMAWVQDDKNEGYILTIAGKTNIIPNSDSRYLFSNFSKVTEIENLQILDTGNVTNFGCMFRYCSSLTSIDLSNFNTSNLINMSGMFERCSSLTSIDLSNFDTSNATNMYGMFQDCNSLTSINLSSFNTGNVKNIGSMFLNCSSLTSIDLSSFNTSNVTSMMGMFTGCSSLTNLDISNFDTGNVESLASTFQNCPKLTTTINIVGNKSKYCENMFKDAATVSPAQITVNYTEENSSLVDQMIGTKSSTSNVVKGTQIE